MMNEPTHSPNGQSIAWKSAFVAELDRTSTRDRWGLALIAVGWIHLALFLACQAVYDPNVESDPRHLGLWLVELTVSLAAIRLISGRGWYRASPAAGLIVRIWGTFLILTFNVATYNSLTGWELDWFKPVWTTLSTFGFATMAWLIDLRFLIVAVQMYFTGLLMVRFPEWNYLIYGLSWWAALQALGLTLEQRRRRLLAPPHRPASEPTTQAAVLTETAPPSP